MIAHTPLPHSTSTPAARPRFGGVLWRLVRITNPIMLPLAGHRWNPIFAVVQHRGRTTGRRYATPVAARRMPGGLVISLSFGSQVDWYRNLVAAGEGTIVWRGSTYRIAAPERIDAAVARAWFHPVQRAALRLTGIDAFVLAPDRAAVDT
jgi:deazaflavin-dependent oxidoreductase (nitroreductase family)